MKSEKVTVSASGPRERVYDDACGTALALEFIGERWSLLIMRELVYGPRRFGEIRANLPGISANVLTQRLESLEAAGIVLRYRLPSPANVQVYDLTDWGRDAAPLMRDLGRWAARSPRHDPSLFMSAASAMMSLQALVDRGRAAALSATVAFHFPGEDFVATVAGGEIRVRRGVAEAPDLAFTGDTLALRRTIYGKAPLDRDGAGGTLAVAGAVDLARSFIDLFTLPAKVG
ncbi:winged helix-turn-helix transcriptional regulator [Methylobacterium radiotolerans]|uniref:winged helix-turn-helix transcriptional regulator n=1 Tax=Methylobacterium radiotolerans TaxID=31998 RepID=UPI000D5D53F0|nr:MULTISPECIES: helix-turn-helix domain-containing protein [Methylobacterium]MDE3748935.1 helix-turn-helix domain-containing protein [Methylobacterium radiotolerans]PVY96240.1 HxlR family transcriptional regulator [Methylobacterium organophilum]